MNDFTKEQNICPTCEKPLESEFIDINNKIEKCWCCYECNLICSPFSIFKVLE
jgi:hypothetical protein